MVDLTVVGNFFSSPLDTAFWVSAVLIVSVWLFYSLIRSVVGRSYKIIANALLLGVFGWALLVTLGVISVVSLVLVSLVLAVFGVVFAFWLFDISRLRVFLRLLVGTVLLASFIEVAALVLYNVPLALNIGSGSLGLHWSNIELSFSNLAYPILPYVYLVFVLFGIVALFVRLLPTGWLNDFVERQFGKLTHWLDSFFELKSGIDGFGFLCGRFVLVLAVLVSAFVSCLFVVFTVLPWANPTHMLVSVDSPSYYQWIIHMRNVDVNSALSFAFSNDRAIFLVLAYAFSYLVGPYAFVQYVSAVLIVLFGVVTLLVLRLLIPNRFVWVLGVLLFPFSFQALGLIYSGYFANMLALILMLVYIVLFFKLLNRWSTLGFLGLLGISVLVLFSHSWTWFVFAFSLLVFLFTEWRAALREKSLWDRFKTKTLFIGSTIIVGLLCDIVRNLNYSGPAGGSVLITAQTSLSFPNSSYLLSGLSSSVDFILGGVYANGLLIFLSFVGFLALVKFRSEVSNFLVAFVFVGCVSILLAAQDFVFDRFLFLMPWTVLSGLGLFIVVRFFGFKFGSNKNWRLGAGLLLLFFVFLVLLNFSFHYLFNINIW
ncbi:MAG TPA: hypothetical protein VLU95_07390 [Candidatus Acidoferrum sp.]|nr:hypothetical protein [Candidatus Acidoferrum sp.]